MSDRVSDSYRKGRDVLEFINNTFTEYFINREHELEFRFQGSLHTLYCVCHHAYGQVNFFSSFDRHLPLGFGNNNCTKIR